MISMRYAWNFAHGRGTVWNAGQHIENSNLLMTLLMSAAALFLNKPLAVLAVQLFGVITLLAVGFVTKLLADEINAGRPHQQLIGIVALVCVLFYYPLAYLTLMGMETGLLTLLLMAATLFALPLGITLAALQPAHRRPSWQGLLWRHPQPTRCSCPE